MAVLYSTWPVAFSTLASDIYAVRMLGSALALGGVRGLNAPSSVRISTRTAAILGREQAFIGFVGERRSEVDVGDDRTYSPRPWPI